MALTNLALFFVSLVIFGTATDVAPGTKQLQLLLTSQEHEKSQFFTVHGCNNDCETSCCDCNIQKQPPLD
ncbi:unnamed protein product [Eruca vesicaria subsp. sativa]|uniref:Uncharacterized protein n=1 Tax=Eruca vesicaria subsp. sativa TaxID=29727 RepID=A0ABC8KUL7_ERUVS|nr:unnamed protein product [Eruca vesicaria subsp. sativa]